MRSKSDSAKKIRTAVTSFDIEEAATVNFEIVKTLGNITAKLDQKENRDNLQLADLIEELRKLPLASRTQRSHEEKMFSSMVKLIAGYEKKAESESGEKKDALLEAAKELRKEARKLIHPSVGGAKAETLKEAFAEKILKISPKQLREARGSIGKAYSNEAARIKKFLIGNSGRSPEGTLNKAVALEKKQQEISSSFEEKIRPAIQETQMDAGLEVDKPISSGKIEGLATKSTDKNDVVVLPEGDIRASELGTRQPKKRTPKTPSTAKSTPKSSGTASALSIDGGPILNKIYDEVRAIRNAVAQPRNEKGQFQKRNGEEKSKGPQTKKNSSSGAIGTGTGESLSTGEATVKAGSAMATVEIGKKSIGILAESIGGIVKSVGGIMRAAVIPALAIAATGWTVAKLFQLRSEKKKANEAKEDAKVADAKDYWAVKDLEKKKGKSLEQIKADNTKIRDLYNKNSEQISPAKPPKLETGTTLEKSTPQPQPTPPPIIQNITNNNTPPASPPPRRESSSSGVRSPDNSFRRFEDRRISSTLPG